MESNIVEKYVEFFRKETGIDFQIKPNTESTILKLVSPIVKLFNPKFDETYIQTLKTYMYVNSKFSDLPVHARFQVAVHESFHAWDWNKIGYLFWILYLIPQLFVLFALGLVWFNWIVALCCLLFLLPIPAYGRMILEVRAYRTFLVYATAIGMIDEEQKQKYVDSVAVQLSEKWYYFAWPFKSDIKRRLLDTKAIVKPEYDYIRKFVRENM